MRVHQGQQRHTCGIDLHANTMYPWVLDERGTICLQQNIPTSAAAFLVARSTGNQVHRPTGHMGRIGMLDGTTMCDKHDSLARSECSEPVRLIDSLPVEDKEGAEQVDSAPSPIWNELDSLG